LLTGPSSIASRCSIWRSVAASQPGGGTEPPERRDGCEGEGWEGCDGFDAVKALKSDKKRHKAVCQTMREDGAFVEAGENDNLIVQKLEANPNAFGIFGYSFLDQNRDKVQGVAIEGVKPEFDLIASGKYPVSRPLFFYVKKAHVGVIPGLKEYIAEFTSEKSWGPDGYLSERGLIPMPTAERKQFAGSSNGLIAMKK